MGFANFEALAMELDDHRQNVSRHFEAVFADPNERNHALDGVWHGAGRRRPGATNSTRLGFRDAAGRRRSAWPRIRARQPLPADVRTSRASASTPWCRA